MTVIKGLRGLKAPIGGSVITIGVFDGVHLGHQKVINRTLRRAKALRVKSVVLTFDPHPAKVLHPRLRVPSLISLDHRIRLISALGVDIVVVANFSRSFAGLSGEEFIKDILITKLGAREICVSDGFYFGKGAGSGLGSLKKMGAAYGLGINIVKPARVGPDIVSSSKIRKAITLGDIGRAAKFLGKPVSVLGTVVRGISLASELGYPTANINPHHEVVPPSGVYAVNIVFEDKILNGVLNIGTRPTFFGPRDCEPAIEVHIFNFRKRIYGEELEVRFVKKIRDEIKFKNRDALVRRIRQDIMLARRVLE